MEPSELSSHEEPAPDNPKDDETTNSALLRLTIPPPASPPPSLSPIAPSLSNASTQPPGASLDSIVPTRFPYGGLPPELWSWILAIANSWSNGGEPHPERFEPLLDFILFMDQFHSRQHASPELMSCCLVSKKFYGLATKLLYRDVALHSFERFQAYVKLVRDDAVSSDPRFLGRALVTLDLKTDSYPPSSDVFRLPPTLEAVEGTAPLPEQDLLKKEEEEDGGLTVYDLLPHTPNIAVLLVGDEQNIRPSFFRTIELRASKVYLACWYHVEVTNTNLPSFLAVFAALSPTLQEVGFHSTSSILSPLPFPNETFPSLTLPHVHSLRLRAPMTGGNGSLFRLLTAWDLPSLKLLHLDPHDEAGPDQPAFLLPFFQKHGERVEDFFFDSTFFEDFFFDSTFFEDFLPYAYLLPNLTSLSAYIFDVAKGADLEPLKPVLGRLKSLLAYSAREYSGYEEEAEEVERRVKEEVERTKRVTGEVNRKCLPMLEDLLWVGGKEEERGGSIIREWLARLEEDGVRTRLVIVDREEPISVFQDPLPVQLGDLGDEV